MAVGLIWFGLMRQDMNFHAFQLNKGSMAEYKLSASG
jgi:hypothetical protein